VNSYTNLIQIAEGLQQAGKDVKVTKLPSQAKRQRKSLYIQQNIQGCRGDKSALGRVK
jgi:hypothetical protein